MDAEQPVGVGAELEAVPAGTCGERQEARLGVLVAVFGVDRFPGPEPDPPSGKSAGVVGPAHEMHLDPALGLVPDRTMVEGCRIDVATRDPVHVREHVAVEGGGDAGRVVVGGAQAIRRFPEVGPDHQQRGAVGPGQGVTRRREETDRLVRVHVADRRAREEAEPPSATGRRQFERPGEVGTHRPDHERRPRRREPGLQGVERLLGDVDRHVGAEPSGREHELRLPLVARAELDQDRVAVDRTGRRRERARMRFEQRHLGAGRVVFRQRRDQPEQPATFGVVEQLRRQGLSCARQAADDLGDEILVGAVGNGRAGIIEHDGSQRSKARRTPVTCHRFSGGKKFR